MILCVGEISRRKNHITIVRALGLLPDKEKYRLVICGIEHGGTYLTEQIRQESKRLGVNTSLLGFRADIAELVHAADIGAIPSVREGLGMAGIQQLCAGVPLVGTNVQGIKSYIITGETGILVDNPYDIDSFARAISKLSDPALRKSMAASCREITKKFDTHRALLQRKQIYHTLSQQR